MFGKYSPKFAVFKIFLREKAGGKMVPHLGTESEKL